MGTKHNLSEYTFAKKFVKDYEHIEKVVDLTRKALYSKYRDYMAVQHILDSLDEAQGMLYRQWVYYKQVLERRGRE